MDLTGLTLGFVLGLAATLVALFLWDGVVRRRRAHSLALKNLDPPAGALAERELETPELGRFASDPAVPRSESSPDLAPALPRVVLAPGLASPPQEHWSAQEGPARPPTERPRATRVPRPTLQLSQRVIVHLYRQGRLAVGEVAPFDLCQLGMTRRLSVRQGTLTKVLQRLRAAGVLTEERRHVEGLPTRLKIYQLTPLGESLGRELRRRSLPSSPFGVPSSRTAELSEPRRASASGR